MHKNFFAAMLCALAMVSCGGGGSGGAVPPIPPNTGPTPLAPMVDSLGRTVAESDFAGGDANAAGVDGTATDKTPIANASVVLSDSAGHSAGATTDANGYYRVNVKGFVPPFIANVKRSDGVVWYAQSMAPVQTRGFVTMNLNGLTDKVASYVADAMNLGGDASKVTAQMLAASPSLLQTSRNKLNTGLISPLTYAGLDPATFDPVRLPYQAEATQPYNKLLALVYGTKSKVTGSTVLVGNFAGDRVPAAVYQPFVNGPASVATFGSHGYIAVDSNGNMFVADTRNGVIRKATPDGVFSTLAGGAGKYGVTNGVGSADSFNDARGIAADGGGNVFVADAGSDTIYKITPAGIVTTVAGGTSGFANGIGPAARFLKPRGVAVDNLGNVYVADTGNNAIRKISPAGVVSTVAGGSSGFANGTGIAASFKSPEGVAVDNSGNVLVADTGNNAIRLITPAGVVSTLAGIGVAGSSNGPGSSASFSYPTSVAVDRNGNVFVAEAENHAIRKITPNGVVSTFAGSGATGFSNGSATAATFNYPYSLAVDTNGNVWVADSFDLLIRKVTPAGVVSTYAGTGTKDIANGPLTTASFRSSAGVAVDSSGNMYVADTGNRAIRKITPAGVVSTLAGSGASGFADGAGTAATFYAPQGIAVDTRGDIYVADTGNHAIRKITPAGAVSTFAGSGSSGFTDGVGAAASFSQPTGVAVDGNGNVFVADTANHAIRKITRDGVVSTVAGNGTRGFVNGKGSTASFDHPSGVAIDGYGNAFVADSWNQAIRKITPDGAVSTFAGDMTFGFVDGVGSAARFNHPSAVAMDGSGNLFVADRGNHGVRKISPSGVVSTLTGDGPIGLVSYRQGRLTNPGGLAVGAGGNVLVTDPNDSVIWILLQ